MYVDTSCSEPAPAIRMQRAAGASRIAFRMKAGASRLDRLYQEGCAKIRLPRPLVGLAPEAVLINTAGGLTGGDRIRTEVDIAANASAVVTTQACERVYRSTGDNAHVSNTLQIAEGGRLAWLPQETILYDGGRLRRTLDVDLEGDAELVAVEAVVFGRTAMGEVVRSGALHDRWRVRRDGKLVFADDFCVGGNIAAKLRKPATLGGNLAMATVLYAGAEPARHLDEVRALVGEPGGASAWGGKMLIRILAESSLALRRRLEPILQLLLGNQPLPKVWHL